MSYRNVDHYGSVYPITPMVLDITAIQTLYGPNFATRSNTTTYFGPNNNSGFQLLDNRALVMTIWDGGGEHDLIDASEQSTAVYIDLRPGHYSSIGALDNNIGIAEAVYKDGVVANLIEGCKRGIRRGAARPGWAP
jgi:serralysin